MASNMIGFDDQIDLFIEPVTGIRVFTWDTDWERQFTLRGHVYSQYVWSPGWNSLYCYQEDEWDITNLSGDIVTRYRNMHRGSTFEECECGLYAYHDYSLVAHHYGSLDPRTILGVIEGKGEVMLGTKGFRASEGRVVGLCLPQYLRTTPKSVQRNFKDSVQQAYPGVDLFDYPIAMLERHPLTYVDKYYDEGLD